jgi:polysaccharide biosynthesis/export protein
MLGLGSLVIGPATLLAGCASSSASSGGLAGFVDGPVADGKLSASKSVDSKSGPTLRSALRKSKLAFAAPELAAPASHDAAAYRIGPQDVIDISVYQVPELQRTVQVAESGTVNLPLVGDIRAANRTARDVEQDVARMLGGKYLQSPQVTVYVKEYNSQRVTVDGSVRKPGVYPIRGQTTLLQMINLAGGLDETSDETDVVVFRGDGSKRAASRYDFSSIRSGQTADPVVQHDDVVVVNASKFKEVFANVLKAVPLTRLFAVPF